jgi:hypothetical protein
LEDLFQTRACAEKGDRNDAACCAEQLRDVGDAVVVDVPQEDNLRRAGMKSGNRFVQTPVEFFCGCTGVAVRGNTFDCLSLVSRRPSLPIPKDIE